MRFLITLRILRIDPGIFPQGLHCSGRLCGETGKFASDSLVPRSCQSCSTSWCCHTSSLPLNFISDAACLATLSSSWSWSALLKKLYFSNTFNQTLNKEWSSLRPSNEFELPILRLDDFFCRWGIKEAWVKPGSWRCTHMELIFILFGFIFKASEWVVTSLVNWNLSVKRANGPIAPMFPPGSSLGIIGDSVVK